MQDRLLQTATNYQVGLVGHESGAYRQAARVLRSVVEELDTAGRRHDRCGLPVFPAVTCRAFLARAHAELGEFDEGLAHGHEALRIAESMDHPYSLVVVCRSLALLFCLRGHLQDARALAERAFATAQERDLGRLTPIGRMMLGRVHTLSGRIAEAVDLLEQTRTEYGALQYWAPAVEGRVYLGEAYQLAHRSEDARAIGVEALHLAHERGLRGIEAYALRLLAEVAAHADPPEIEAAEARYDEALAVATELGMRPLVAHCRLGLGQLSRQAGKPEQAKAAVTAAATMYRDMDMRFWLEKAEAVLGPPG